MHKSILTFLIIISLVAIAAGSNYRPDKQYYGTGNWPSDSLGNHRIVIQVENNSDAVWAHLPWRRRDTAPDSIRTIIIDQKTETIIENKIRYTINREYGDIIFEPVSGSGKYYIYYMPYDVEGTYYPTVTYQSPSCNPEPEWLNENQLSDNSKIDLNRLPKAELIQFQSINEFNSFFPMEVIATDKEVRSLIDNNQDKDFLIFPEKREFPIRMTEEIPYRWIKKGLTSEISFQADKYEYYVFQLGIFAAYQNVENISLEFSDLVGQNGNKIEASQLTCINTRGTNWTGEELDKKVNVKKGKIQALWCGIDIPQKVKSQKYKGSVIIKADNCDAQKIKINLEISNKVLPDRGDDQPERLTRLRWLNSMLAFDDSLVPPYSPLKREENRLSCLGRKLIIGENGLPDQIKSYFAEEMTHLSDESQNILQAPFNFRVINSDNQELQWRNSRIKYTKEKDGVIAWNSRTESDEALIDLNGKLEFDGFADFKLSLIARKSCKLKDIRLEIPMKKSVAKYMMGMGEIGGYRPEKFNWKWDKSKNQDAIWLGDVNAGMQVSFRDTNYARPLNTNFYQLNPLNMPPSWYNQNRGGFEFSEKGDKLILKAYSGKRKLEKGDKLNFYFSLLITPFRTINTKKHFSNRYYHRYEALDTIKSRGANIVNVHHATKINPFINYPFLRPDMMKKYIDKAHSMDMKVKIYYTVRELTNRAPELYALRSLGSEILSDGDGGGWSWLQEHLESDYIAGWFVPRLKDAAVINSGVSRWHNYYVEGLDWLVKNVGIDGLYIDDVAFDRTTMKRVRKVLVRENPSALIDLHSANQFNPRDGYANSANLYLEHLPYIDRLWFGEYFDYTSDPDYWMIEVSGIPFGIMGEMLQDGGNPYRGMVFGMTSRMPWAGDPSALWQVWDEFGLTESDMIGYWVDNNPVQTNHEKVLATVYKREKSALIALASWAEKEAKVNLKIDWNKIGLKPDEIEIKMPRIENFQAGGKIKLSDSFTIKPEKGRIILLK